MSVISAPEPDLPISTTWLPPTEAAPRRRQFARSWPVVAAIIVGLVAGYGVGRSRQSAPASPVLTHTAAPSLHTTLEWMFNAALAHEAVDEHGSVMAPASPPISVASVETLDELVGPMVAIVSSADDYLAAYEIHIERDELDWTVRATRLAGQG